MPLLSNVLLDHISWFHKHFSISLWGGGGGDSTSSMSTGSLLHDGLGAGYQKWIYRSISDSNPWHRFLRKQYISEFIGLVIKVQNPQIASCY